MKSLLDMFGISTWPGKAKLDEQYKDKAFVDVLALDNMDHIYTMTVEEEYKDEKYEKKSMKQKYFFEYVKKKSLV